MKQLLKKVRNEWNAKIGVPMNDKPTLIDKSQAFLMVELIREETNELEDAINRRDLVEIADAQGDILYLIFGLINQYGMQDISEKIFEEIHKSNKTKLIDGKILRRDEKAKSTLKQNQFLNVSYSFLTCEC